MGFGKLIQRKLLAAPGSEAKQQREDLGGQSDQDDDSLLPAGLDPAAGASSSYAGCSELSGDGRSMHSSSGSSTSGASSDSGREDEVRLPRACRNSASSSQRCCLVLTAQKLLFGSRSMLFWSGQQAHDGCPAQPLCSHGTAAAVVDSHSSI